MENEQYQRTIGLIGEDNFHTIQNKRIAVVGLGGVGGTALETLARSGFQHFLLVDDDVVNPSNMNRQIIYTANHQGEDKVSVAKDRILSINKAADITTINLRISSDNCHVFDEFKIDFIVDAIDDVPAKVALSKYALSKNIPLIVSLGMANRLDPSKVIITRLDKTTMDPLAKKYRYELRKAGFETNQIMAAMSKEIPVKDGTHLNSMMMVPSAAGLNIAYYVLSYFLK